MTSAAWIVPSLIEGSGGHRTILQNADYLQRHGYQTTIYLENGSSLKSHESPGDAIARLFGYRFPDVRVGWHAIEAADLIFATIWYSAKLVRDLQFSCKKLYFVQDWEACFNPMGDAYLMAENSYRYGLTPITIGNWLRYELQSRFGVRGMSFDFCADHSIYRSLAHVQRQQAVCFICQPEKPRRGAVIGIEALGIVKHLMPEVQIYLYGSKQPSQAWFQHENLGLLGLNDCNALYNRCSVGLCISSSNPSRIPFEMMSAGLPVVELHRNNTLYDLPESACLLCDPSPESLAEGILALLRDEKRRQAMAASGIQFMQRRTLEHGMQQFLDAVRWIESNPVGTQIPLREAAPFYRSGPVTASAFLRTLQVQPKRLSSTKGKLRKGARLLKKLRNILGS